MAWGISPTSSLFPHYSPPLVEGRGGALPHYWGPEGARLRGYRPVPHLPHDRVGGSLPVRRVHQLVAVELLRRRVLRLRVIDEGQQVADRLLLDPQAAREVVAVEV